MEEKIKCPITLGEYENIIKSESVCNCKTKCNVCKCKQEEVNIHTASILENLKDS